MTLPRPSLPCQPPLYARSGYAQTLLGNYLRMPKQSVVGARTEIALPDGDTLVARVFAPQQGRSRLVVLAVFHGLGGHIDRPYMKRAVDLGLARGCEVWAVNHRGCGEGRGLARGIYHSGVAPDLGQVFAAIRRSRPGARIIGVGFSLSANAILLTMGRGVDGIAELPDAAIAVNPPIDLGRCAELICAPHHVVFNLYFLRGCMRHVREREADGLIEPGRYPVSLRMSLKEFDDAVTAPMGGFASRHDYYARASALPHLAQIERPTVILHAEDDPFIDPADFGRARYGPGVHLHLERYGGHLGYVGEGLPYLRWLDYGMGHYLDELLSVVA